MEYNEIKIYKRTDSRTIGWNGINIAIWLTLNANKPTRLLNFKTNFLKNEFQNSIRRRSYFSRLLGQTLLQN